MLKMHKALLGSKKVIAVLSESYSLNQGYAAAEWAAADTCNKLLVVKITAVPLTRKHNGPIQA